MTKPYVKPIEDDTIRLRLLEEADLEMTLEWRNQDDIRRWFFTSSVLAFDQHRNWFLNYQTRDNDFIFIIESKTLAGVPVGQISLYDIDFENRRGEYGRLMIGNPIAIRQGFAKKATRLILQFAFETVKLDEVYLSVLLNNEPAINLYTACGFLVNGQDEKTLMLSIKKPGSRDNVS